MNKKNLMYMIFCILCIFFISNSQAFEIVPNYLNFSAFVGEETLVPITINNLYTYDLYNVTIATNNFFTIHNIEKIPFNKSNSTNLIFSTPTTMNNSNITVIFMFYKKENITITPNSSTIIIANNSYIPNYLEIVQSSSITWTNLDTIIHNVKDDGGEFDRDIMPGESFTYTFNTIKNYTYRDRFFGFAGQVKVKSQLQEVLVHYSNLDISKVFTVNATYKQGNYVTNLLTNNITMDYNGTTEGVFQLINNGNATIYNVHFTGEWMSFAQNYFNLASGQTKYVTFTVSPIIYSTEQTNTSYTKLINIVTDNAGSSSLNVPVFINYAVVMNINNSNAERAFIEWLCGTNTTVGAHPDSFLCNGTQIIYVNRTIYEPPPLWINYSAEDIANIKNSSAQAMTLVTRFASSQQERDDRLEGLNQNTTNAITSIDKNLEATKERTDNMFMLSILIIGIIIFTAIICGGLWTMKTMKRKRNLDYQNTY